MNNFASTFNIFLHLSIISEEESSSFECFLQHSGNILLDSINKATHTAVMLAIQGGLHINLKLLIMLAESLFYHLRAHFTEFNSVKIVRGLSIYALNLFFLLLKIICHGFIPPALHPLQLKKKDKDIIKKIFY